MKLLFKTVTALTMGAMMTMGANAMMPQGEAYVGAKAGQFKLSDNDEKETSTAYGVYGGMNFTENFGAELDYVGSRKTKVTEEDGDTLSWKPSTLGAYGTVRYTVPNTNLYAKGKLGVARTKLKTTAKDADSGKEFTKNLNKTGAAVGVGVGYNVLPNVAIEAEYTRLPKVSYNDEEDGKISVKHSLTLGVNAKF